MLGWFKKKFGKKKEQTEKPTKQVQDVAALPAAPETTHTTAPGTGGVVHTEQTELPSIPENREATPSNAVDLSQPAEISEPSELSESGHPVDDKESDDKERDVPAQEQAEPPKSKSGESTEAVADEKEADATEVGSVATLISEDSTEVIEQLSAEQPPVAEAEESGSEEVVQPAVEASSVSEEVAPELPPASEEENLPNNESAQAEAAEEIPPQENAQNTDEKVIEAEAVRPAVRDASTQPVPKPRPGSSATPVNVVRRSEVEPRQPQKKSLFSRLSERLSKTREAFTYQIDALFLGKRVIDAELLDDLEEVMITSDLGVETTMELLDYARRKVKRNELSDPNSLKEALKAKITEYIMANDADASLVMPDEGPFVIMVIGVNGVGKTTTIGKIANKFMKAGSSVMLVAGDTFRAAAVSQLQIWGERNNVEVVAHKEGADPSSVIFDALGIAQEKNYDVVLVDTAGRLHTKANLMEELKKIKRVMDKRMPGAPHEILLVIDATTGQNGVSQAKLFNEAVGVSGITLTKLDGTSKGGIVVNICRELRIPIRFIGIGEQIDDLRDFDPSEFVDALFKG